MDPKKCKLFEVQLQQLINQSGITITEAYYILKSAMLELKVIYQQMLDDTTVYEEQIEVPLAEAAESDVEQEV